MGEEGRDEVGDDDLFYFQVEEWLECKVSTPGTPRIGFKLGSIFRQPFFENHHTKTVTDTPAVSLAAGIQFRLSLKP
jgi:hypothetical protein